MIKKHIQDSIITSLKARKQTELRVLRFLLSLINYAEIDKQRELTDEETQTLLQKEAKKRQEAIELFKKGNRTDLVSDEEKQLEIFAIYLPKQLGEKELQGIVEAAVHQASRETPLGQIIMGVMTQVKGKADGAVVANLVRQKLAEKFPPAS